MNVKEKLMIYPYDFQSSPIIRHSSLLEKYEITRLVSLPGFGLDGCDACVADNGPLTGQQVYADFDESLEFCDTVLFTDSINTSDSFDFLRKNMNSAIEKKKNIICTFSLEENNINDLQESCNIMGVYFKYYGKKKTTELKIGIRKLFSLKTPVIFVLGVGEKSGKFNIQLSLREKLMQSGYKVSQIGTKNYCGLLGFHSFPQFMFDSGYSEADKIFLFNHFVKNIEVKDEPDIIIIGVPGGIMRYDDVFTNGFGITAYEVSNAVMPDAVILSFLYDNYNEEFFEQMATSAKYKFGYEIDCFCTSNIMFNWDLARIENDMSYTTINWDMVTKKINSYRHQMEKPLYNILDSKDMDDMYDYITNKMSDYGYAEII